MGKGNDCKIILKIIKMRVIIIYNRVFTAFLKGYIA